MLRELQSLTSLGEEMIRRARGAGAQLIWRTQARTLYSAVVREGKPETSVVSSSSGHGVHVFGAGAGSTLASRDDLQQEPALQLLERSIRAAEAGDRLGFSPAEFFEQQPIREQAIPHQVAMFDDIDLPAVVTRLVELEREIQGRVPGVGTRVGYRADLDIWRIFRSDGTDVLFAMPRCNVTLRATGGEAGARHAVGVSLPSPGPDLLWDEERVATFLKRAEDAARLARALPDAPVHPAGSFPIVIDYALAKGLAHEAFGHASEADTFRSSILAQSGKFLAGKQVGASHVSIIDEPVPDDHAWQPFSANGLRRDRAVIVDHGRLADPLSDPWSAAASESRLTGSSRAESFRNPPLPRMTNIRIEVDDPLPAPGAFEDYGPEEVRALLAEAGVFRRHPRVVFLSGYSGGQVNTASGDFVFNCKVIYTLGEDGIEMYKPAIFSGSMFGALNSIREAFGPLKLDALGYCGKWGQSVPSSGGSHYFLMLDPDETVRLGGSG